MLGYKLKQKRLEKGMNQSDLAQDICTQAMISKIEKGSVTPTGKLLKKLSQKLNVTTAYFYNEESNTAHFKRLEQLIRRELHQTNYDIIANIMKSNQTDIDSCNERYFKDFFQWIDGLLNHFVHNNSRTAINSLKELLENREDDKLNLEILNSLANIHGELGELKKADSYFEHAFKISKSINSSKEKTKLLYNYATNLIDLERLDVSLEIILNTIDELINNQSMYMLGYCYYQKGYLLKQFDDRAGAEEAFNRALWIFTIKNYEKMMTMTKMALKKGHTNEK